LPRGVPTPWGRARTLFWSWWTWALAAVAAAAFDHPWIVAILVLGGIVAYLGAPPERAPVYGLDHEFAIESEEFLTTITGAIATPFLEGNDIQIYNNGDEFYPAMIDAISGAEESVTMEAYIYWAGHIGNLFANAMAAKAKQGVAVKILLDAVGSATIGSGILQTLERSGCVVRWYRPLQWYSLNRINNRTHRKTLVVDGRVGFTGGAGIADVWMGNAENPDHWRDVQIRICGPAVAPLQTGFARNWLETTNELLSGSIYYPFLSRRGPFRVQTILSSPETGSSTVRTMYYLSIVCARKSIWIANPYFIPDPAAIDILTDAKRRGVDVKIMLMGIHHDNEVTRLNSVRLYGQLLEAGIEIYEYNRTHLHHKLMVCDGVWSTIGTTNFDNRSFALNEETSICIHDRTIAERLESTYRNDLLGCRRVVLEEWRKRPWKEKVLQQIASILEEQA
jgi:cardiolipin synthase